MFDPNISLYANYIKEREGFDTIEVPEGFATYICKKQECYLRDIYVVPIFRKNNIAKELADEVSKIAKERGCKYLIGTVSPNDKSCTDNLKVLLSYGFRMFKNTQDLIYMVKEL